MSTRYGDRGFGRYGDADEERSEERESERDTDRGYGEYGDRHGRVSNYGTSPRDFASERGGGDYGSDRDYNTRDYNTRDYGSRESNMRDYESRDYGSGSRDYGSRYGREGRLGGYAGSPSRQRASDEYGRDYGTRDYGRERERMYGQGSGDDRDRVRAYDTDYGRTTSRFYGRSGYDYGRDDYDRPDRGDARGEYGRRAYGGHPDEREGRGRGWWDRAADEVLSWFGDEDAGHRRRTDDPRAARGRGEGKFRGRGPKNYRRSDERIREEISDRLTENEWLDASDVDLNVSDGEVVLSGTVDSRYAKRLAEDIAESVSGVSHVQNNLRVHDYQAATPGINASTASTAPTGASDITPTTADDVTGTTDPDDPTPTGRASRAAGRS
jgi:osmotically-inducible protein OsmY